MAGNDRFKRNLGLFSLLAMSLGTVIGSGWLLLPGVVAARAGPASVLSWLLGGPRRRAGRFRALHCCCTGRRGP